MTEAAARFVRVSTGEQDETTQFEAIDRHITRHGYQVAAVTYQLHDVSAAKGEHAAVLDRIVADISAGKFSVLVIAGSSRIERRDDADELMMFLARVHLAGGRVESASEPMFGKRDVASKVITLLSQHGNAEYVRKLKTDIARGMRTIAANGAFSGREPWGAVSVGVKKQHNCRLVPTTDMHEYGPQILDRVAAGASLGDVARWLTSEGVRPGNGDGSKSKPGARWWAKSVAEVVRSKTMLGRYACAYTVTWTDDEGKHTETLRWTHTFDAVASYDQWKAANDALDGRGAKWKAGGQRTGRKPVEPLSGAAKCVVCAPAVQSPMYRLSSGNMRCTGTGADRHGCGARMVPVAVARQLADMAFAAQRWPMFAVTRTPGNAAEVAVRRDELEQREREIANSDMTRAQRRAAMAELDELFDVLDATEITPDTEELAPTGETYAGYWARLDEAGRHAFLRSGEYAVFLGPADGTETAELDGHGIWLEETDADRVSSEALAA